MTGRRCSRLACPVPAPNLAGNSSSPRMNHDTRWLTRLAIEHGLLTREQAQQIRARLGDADLMTFAQDLIDSGVVPDVEKLEQIAGLALAKSKHGPPAPTVSPFESSGQATAATPQ